MQIQTGVDIIEINRIEDVISTRPEFIDKYFNINEIEYCTSKKRSSQHFAVRFAAKEAVFKALGCSDISFKNISIQNDPDGKPRVILDEPWKMLEESISISLSHSDNYAVAHAIYIKE